MAKQRKPMRIGFSILQSHTLESESSLYLFLLRKKELSIRYSLTANQVDHIHSHCVRYSYYFARDFLYSIWLDSVVSVREILFWIRSGIVIVSEFPNSGVGDSAGLAVIEFYVGLDLNCFYLISSDNNVLELDLNMRLFLYVHNFHQLACIVGRKIHFSAAKVIIRIQFNKMVLWLYFWMIRISSFCLQQPGATLIFQQYQFQQSATQVCGSM